MSSLNQTIDLLAIVFLFIGLFVALSPHATHMVANHPATHTHEKEITSGLILFIIGIVALIWNNKALKSFKK